MSRRTSGDNVAPFEGVANQVTPGSQPLDTSAPRVLEVAAARSRSGQRISALPPSRPRSLVLPPQVSLPAIAATLTITALAAITVALPGAGTPAPATSPTASTFAVLQTGLAIVAVAVAIVLVTYAYFGDQVASAWFGSSMLVMGTVTLGSGAIAAAAGAHTSVHQVVAWMPVGGRIAMICLIVTGLWTSRRRDLWRRRPTRLAQYAVMMTAGGMLVVAALPASAVVFGSPTDLASPTVPGASGGPLALVWLAAAIACAVVAQRRHDAIAGWVAATLALFAIAEVANVVASSAAGGAIPVTFVGQLAALAMLGAATMRQLGRSVQQQRMQLLRRAVDAEAQAEERRRRQQVQAHEARNALSGVVNTLRLLDGQQVHLDDTTQRNLLAASFTELVRLQRVFCGDDGIETAATHRLADALGSVLSAGRASGMVLHVDIPRNLEVYGSWSAIAQAVQNLLENARRYAPGSTTEVTAQQVGDRVELRVADHGPGLALDEQATVFNEGVRGHASSGTRGSGLGLAITREMMARSGGQVWAEPTPGGGATFVVSLPTRPPSAADLMSASDERLIDAAAPGGAS